MTVKNNGLSKGCVSEELRKLLISLASSWGDVIDDPKKLRVIPLKGAMTNEVYQINWPIEAGTRSVLVRVYGEGVEVFFDRDDEIRTFECMSEHGHGPRLLGRFADGRVEEFIHAKCMSEHGHGPRLLGRFADGRVEEFIHAKFLGFGTVVEKITNHSGTQIFLRPVSFLPGHSYKTLSAADLRDPEISALIAAKLREFHRLEMPGPKNVFLWDRMRNWVGEAKRLSSPKDAKEFCLDTLEEEISMLQKEFSQDHQDIGFCHNDLQYGNIMIDEKTRAITIIDYEYASYNPVAYDLANHFCEMVANYHTDTPHILDYSKYPDQEERHRFIRTYLSSAGNQPSDSEVEKLACDAEKYTLANHLFWGIWGIISGHVNTIEFNYMEYARQRFQQYWLRKPLLLGSSKARSDSVINDSSISPK